MQHLSANERLRLAHALREADYRYADGVRLARLAAGTHPPRSPLRRTLGRSLVRLGERLAAEPPLEPSRSP